MLWCGLPSSPLLPQPEWSQLQSMIFPRTFFCPNTKLHLSIIQDIWYSWMNKRSQLALQLLPTAFFLPAAVNSCSHNFRWQALFAALSPGLKDDMAFSFILFHSLSLIHHRSVWFCPLLLDIPTYSTFPCTEGLEFTRKSNAFILNHISKAVIWDLHLWIYKSHSPRWIPSKLLSLKRKKKDSVLVQHLPV